MSMQSHARIIDEAFAKVQAITRQEALKKVVKQKNDRSILAVTFHPALPSVAATVRTHWEVMTNQSNSLKRVFPKAPMVAYRRAKNLKDHLVKAKVSSKRRSARLKTGYGRCNEGCKLCWLSTSQISHTCYRSRKSWKITAPHCALGAILDLLHNSEASGSKIMKFTPFTPRPFTALLAFKGQTFSM